MRLLVLHPQLLQRSCDDCQRWIYDERHQRLLRGGRPVPRPAGVPTPCASCPKQDPQRGGYFDRHAADFAWLLRRRWEVAATGGACLTEAERLDPLLHRNLALAEVVLGEFEAQRIARHVLHALTHPGALS